jgi:phosphate transport system substrate-binding protein
VARRGADAYWRRNTRRRRNAATAHPAELAGGAGFSHRLSDRPKSRIPAAALLGLAAALAPGCGDSGARSGGGSAQKIANVGSDTMLQLAMAWSEAYRAAAPSVSVEVNGGGSGVGIAGLINGGVDLANSSRAFEEKEVADLREKQGKDAVEFLVGYDALSIYVHKDNPLESISMEQLAQIYAKDGKIRKWSDLGVSSIPGAKGDEIIVVSRQNNSGTHHYFKEAVIGKKNAQRPDTINQNGSADVVNLVGTTPNAIGYSGMGYRTDKVKVLEVSQEPGGPSVPPSIETTLDKTYPISRPMFVYTAGAPPAHVKAYVDWIVSEPGQRILIDNGYVPLPRQ